MAIGIWRLRRQYCTTSTLSKLNANPEDAIANSEDVIADPEDAIADPEDAIADPKGDQP